MPFAWNALDAPLSGSTLGVISLLPLPSTFGDHPPGAHSPWHPLPSTAKSMTQHQGLPRPTSASPASTSRAVARAALPLHHQCPTQAGHSRHLARTGCGKLLDWRSPSWHLPAEESAPQGNHSSFRVTAVGPMGPWALLGQESHEHPAPGG